MVSAVAIFQYTSHECTMDAVRRDVQPPEKAQSKTEVLYFYKSVFSATRARHVRFSKALENSTSCHFVPQPPPGKNIQNSTPRYTPSVLSVSDLVIENKRGREIASSL
jgi:hypothetical protein